MLEMTEVQDGLLSSPKKEIMKARCPELFPEQIQEYFNDKNKIRLNKIEIGIERVIVKDEDKKAVFDADFFTYLKTLGKIEYYLSNVRLPCDEGDYYPLLAKYKYGWVIISPLEA